ncbi:hypothetical protein RB195_018716 [Necator americanus]|uniref:Uncharacterized protein n=1 Tax=Necator americanus TaxID=51031 RepID=A0ABR1CC27_NECAM
MSCKMWKEESSTLQTCCGDKRSLVAMFIILPDRQRHIKWLPPENPLRQPEEDLCTRKRMLPSCYDTSPKVPARKEIQASGQKIDSPEMAVTGNLDHNISKIPEVKHILVTTATKPMHDRCHEYNTATDLQF